MSVVTAINSEVTADTVRAAISSQTGFNTDTVTFTPTTTGALYPASDLYPGNNYPDGGSDPYIVAFAVMFNGSTANRATGKRVAHGGLVCGMDVCGPNSRSLRVAQGAQLTASFTYSQTGSPNPPDGNYPVVVWSRSDTEGWG